MSSSLSVHYFSHSFKYCLRTMQHQTSCRRAAATICHPSSGNTIYAYHVRIWKGHHYCMSMLACQYNQPKRPGDLDLWPFDLESGVRVTCDVGYLCANFSLPRPLCSRLRPDVRDRQTDRQTDVRQTSNRCQTKASLNTRSIINKKIRDKGPNITSWP